jgi:hypothetical protein
VCDCVDTMTGLDAFFLYKCQQSAHDFICNSTSLKQNIFFLHSYIACSLTNMVEQHISGASICPHLAFSCTRVVSIVIL